MKKYYVIALGLCFFTKAEIAFSQCSDVQMFSYTGALQPFVVPPGVDSLSVESYGAAGGNGNQPTSPGGLGAKISAKIDVTAGETLNIIVGGQGVSGVAGLEGGGGGGGSFVIRSTGNVPLIIAGGGGGGSYQASVPGYGASISTTGGAGGYVPTLPGMGGFSDNGGGGGCGAGGGGWTANGSSNMWANGGTMAGGAGGTSLYIGDGGFGGGGAAYHGGGGGGGYSGGGGGTYTIGGGGGASYMTGNNQVATANFQSGNGMVMLSWDVNYFVQDSVLTCYGTDYTFPDGTVMTNIVAPVVHNSNLIAVVGGCDSVIETTVDVIAQVNVAATQAGITITATAVGAGYVWVDCDNGYSPLPFATSQSYTALVDGNYACIVTENGCSDTTACFNASFAGIDNEKQKINLTLFPNPASEIVQVNFGKIVSSTTVEVRSITGGLVIKQSANEVKSIQIDISDLAPGIYFVQVKSVDNNSSETIKLIKK